MSIIMRLTLKTSKLDEKQSRWWWGREQLCAPPCGSFEYEQLARVWAWPH